MNVQEVKDKATDLLDRELFKKWIESHSKGWNCGRARVAHDCPLARYLQHQLTGYKVLGVFIGEKVITICGRDDSGNSTRIFVDTPSWCQWFVCIIDQQSKPDQRVYTKQCLSALG